VSKVFNEVFWEDVEDTYLDEDSEFSSWREFSFKGPSNTYVIRKLLVIWNHDILRNLPSTVLYGQLLVGDVLLLTRIIDWPQRPRRGQLIWTPRDTGWEILQCREIFRTVYRISLQQVESTS
jgi:hypothetical protein